MNIKILTATFNHCKWINNLYTSLLNQTSKDFEWIVVDDGSTDETENVIKTFIDDGDINIRYVKKNNGGKSSAINVGLDLISEDDIVIIIDDDETLLDNAIKVIQRYCDDYNSTTDNIGIINFQRGNKHGGYFSNYIPENDIKMSYFEFSKLGYEMDGYIAYFGYAIKNYRFPIFEGEKYVGPSVLIMLCNEQYNMIYAKDSLGESEYMDDGITKQGRRLRLKNPCGMIYRCVLQQNKKMGLKKRLKYSMAGFAYKFISGYSFKDLNRKGIDTKKLNKLMLIPGYLLSLRWKKDLK